MPCVRSIAAIADWNTLTKATCWQCAIGSTSASSLFAVVGVILWTQMDDHTIANILLIIGVIMKIAEVCIRLFKK